MKAYIQGIGNVSAQPTPTSEEWQWNTIQTNPATITDMDYAALIPPMQLRRMSKAVRMGIAASMMALKQAGIEKPDTIITGTAYGCLADTELFLTKLIQQEEQMLTPTAFIQSTHNTVSGQIALHLKCHGRNFTYTQRGHSFEHAMHDALLTLQEDSSQQVLVGAMDEISKHSQPIIQRFGTFKQEGQSFFDDSEGTISGEGAYMFVLRAEPNKQSLAAIIDVTTCMKEQAGQTLQAFLEKHGITPDVVLLGLNGDTRYDANMLNIARQHTTGACYTYKNYCGEQPIASGFATMMAASMLHYGTNVKPLSGESKEKPEHVLIWHHYKNHYHSFMLLGRP